MPKLVAGTIESIFGEIFNPLLTNIELIMNQPIVTLSKTYNDPNKIEITL